MHIQLSQRANNVQQKYQKVVPVSYTEQTCFDVFSGTGAFYNLLDTESLRTLGC